MSFDSCKLIPMRVYTLQYFIQSTNVQICNTRAGAWFYNLLVLDVNKIYFVT